VLESSAHPTGSAGVVMPPADRYAAIVVGGGMIGCSVALYLAEHAGRVLLLEREPGLLQRASYANQARVHNGYHYPRSLLTGLRSRVNFPRFIEEFADCVDSSFEKYYGVARHYSKVSAEQFLLFCRRIGAEYAPAPARVKALFDPWLVEDVYAVREHAFDAVKLRDLLVRRLASAGVDVRTDAEALDVREVAGGELRLRWRDGGGEHDTGGRYVFNCTYSRLNDLLRRSHVPAIPLKHELTEMALVDMPEPLRHIGVTMMCGPFFSFMPFPSRGLHTFSHVRYTPHRSVEERADAPPPAWVLERTPDDESNFRRMLLDATRYVPALRDARQVDSLWETKTVLPSSEADDSRPILFRMHHGLHNLFCILGGKIDNVFDVIAELDAARAAGVIA
jgi:glycine/D-amino acid oxidase-like deaminating enzyme